MTSLKHRIISAEEADEYVEWHEPVVIGKISNELDLQPPTANDMRALHKDAYDEGFNMGRKEGRAQGLKEGKTQAENESRELLDRLRSIIQTLASPIEQLDNELEKNIAELTLVIARQIIRREIKTEPGEIVAIVREAVKALPVTNRRPTVFLHPEDVQLVRNALSVADDDQVWRFEEDLLLTRGDCRVETESSIIDATIEARLNAIAVNMLGDERNMDGEGNDTHD